MRVPRVAHEAVKAIEATLRAANISGGREGRVVGTARPEPAATKDVPEQGPGDRALLISLKPRYANAILEGIKTVELRRTRPNLPDGSLVILYSSTPTRAVVGWAHLAGIRAGTPLEIWDEFGAAAAINGPEFHAYFDGTDQAFALELDSVVAVRPIPLEVIRSIGVQPPQSWRYVAADVSSQIQASATV